MSFKVEDKMEAAIVPARYAQQQELWDPFQYRHGFEQGESSQTMRWVEGLLPVREY
jgi:hypothetical protein